MIVYRIPTHPFPTVRLCGATLADAQKEFLTLRDVTRSEDVPPSDVVCIVSDDLPLLTNDYLERLERVCLAENCGFRLGNGYIAKQGYDESLRELSDDEARPFSPDEYAFFANAVRKKILRRHAKNGVLLHDLNSVFIDFQTILCKNAEIRPFVTMEKSYVGAGSVVGEGCRLRNAVVGDGCELLSSTLFDCTVGNGAHIGPYAYLRQNAHVGEGCRIGDFVEIKNSVLSDGVKAAHLVYIGDATVGTNTNVGCGTVFCNYDGKYKHRTTVGENVFIGANTNLVAPVVIGNGAFLAAGGTITNDVPDNAFVIARCRQTVKKQN